MRLPLIVLSASLLSPLPAVSQAAPESTIDCVPTIAAVGNSGTLVFKCDRPFVDKVRYVVDDEEAAALSQHYAISPSKARNLIQELQSNNVSPYEMPAQFQKLVSHSNKLATELDAIAVDEKFEPTWKEVISAVGDGNLDRADTLYSEFRKLAAQDKAHVFKDPGAALQADARHAELKAIRFDYEGAAAIDNDALHALPPDAPKLAVAEIKVGLAEALLLGNAEPGTTKVAIDEAIAATEPLAKTAPVLRMRALGYQINQLVHDENLKEAVAVFESKVKPLLASGEAASTADASFCYACVGRAYIDADMIPEGLDILKAGEALALKSPQADPEALSAIYQNMWLAYALQRNWVAAKEALDKSEALLKQVAPDEMHPHFVQTYLSKSLHADTSEEKLALTKRAFVIATHVYPPDQGPYQTALNQSAEAAGGLLSENADAESLGRKEALAALDEIYQLNNRSIAVRFGEDAWVQKAESAAAIGNGVVQSDSAVAVDYYRPCIDISRAHHVESENIAHCFFNAAQIIDLDKLGTFDDVEPLYKEALAMYNTVIGVPNSQTQDVRKVFVQFYVRSNKPQKAVNLAEMLVKSLQAEPDFPEKTAYIDEIKSIEAKAKSAPAD